MQFELGNTATKDFFCRNDASINAFTHKDSSTKIDLGNWDFSLESANSAIVVIMADFWDNMRNKIVHSLDETTHMITF